MSEAALAHRRVLVVEDEYLTACEIVRALEEAGAAVIGPAPSVGQALALIDGAPDVQIGVLDVNLCGEPVYPLADTLTECGVPFVFTTGYDASVIPARFKDVARLEKPVSSAAVVHAVEQAMSR